ncbi:MAG: polyketide synthase dehydratase domain-containing protein, partial [Alcanivoracaceae bacterium]|nr:polyketide synthase dehydratase domain-containing protein [Alcanivoracaceae bacterium]
FEGKTRSNDTNLLSEVGDPILAKLLQKSAKASVKDGEGELYNLSQEWEEWNVDNENSNDLFATIRDFSQVFSSDINRAAYAVVAANVSLNHFYKKWMFECRTNQHSYYITAFSALVCHEMLSKSDFYKISTKQHPDIDKCLSDLNNKYWEEINQVLCDKQRFEHRKAIIEKKQFIAAIANKDASLCNSQTNVQRISLGSIDDSYSHLVKHEISNVDQWQQTLLAVWLNGHNICWNELYPQAQFNRLPLPGYLFKKVHFWASKSEENDEGITIDSKPIENIKIVKIQEVSRQVKSILSTLLDLEEVHLDTQKNFDAYGFDSMAYTLLCEKINNTYDVALTPACFYGFKNVQKLIECIEQQLSENINSKKLSDQQHTDSINVSQQENNNDIAIIGYCGTLPKAETLEQFWNNLITGVDGISEIPKLRWDWRDYYSTNLQDKNKSPSKWGGFMPDIDCFDAAFFGISPQEAKLMDPQQRILLQTVWHAIEHSGHKPASLSGTDTGVFIGASTSDYEELIRKHELAAHASTGMNRSIIANRISFLLDLHGPSEVIDTACSSSLVAIHKAIEAIKMGHCQCAIAGGVNALITPTHYISYGKAGMLSPDGHCKTFDKDANGYVRAEGVGAIVLKSLTQALADNDSIHAVIKASGINHGGRSNSLTAPNPNAQAQLIFDTYKKAGIHSHSIDYIENHGTGTPLGDPIEINGLTKAFTDLDSINNIESQEKTEHKCYLASVKSNIGHLEAAAGVAGILKLLLALKNQVLPASQNFQEINPYIKLNENRFEILQKNRPWPQNNKHKLRRAGISSFGFGGVNAHLVLEEYINNNNLAETEDECLVILSAKNAQALDQYAQNYLSYLSTENFHIPLQNIAYTSQLGRNEEKFRLAICATCIKGLIAELNNFINKLDSKHYTFNVVEQESGEKVNEENLTTKELQKLWSEGLKIDWNRFYENKDIQLHGLQRVALPTYPFQKKRFWLSTDKKQQTSTNPAKNSMHKNSNTSLIKNIAKDSFIAKEHVINGQAISPGVYSLDLIYRALVASGSRMKNMVLLDVFFRESILFAGNNVVVTINNKPHKKGRLLEIRANGNKNIATQAIAVKDENLVFNKELASLERYRAIDINSLYDKLKDSGFDYGANFRVIKNILHYKGKYIAQLAIISGVDGEDFIIDPRLLDGGLQTCLACLLHNNIIESYIPMMIEKVVVAGKLPDTVFAYVTPKQALNSKQSVRDSYAFDIQIVDENSQPYIELSTVIFKKIPQKNKVSKQDTTDNNIHKLKPALLLTKKSSRVQSAVALTNNENKTLLSDNKNENNNTKNPNIMENQQVNTKILLNKTIEYFLSIIANTASLEKNEIDTKQSFKEYGIDSFLTLSIIRNLEDDFGDLRKTLLFEASNILELADIFIEEQPETLMKLLDIKPQQIEQQLPVMKEANLANAFAQNTPIQVQQPDQMVKPTNNNQYQVISDQLLDQDSVLSDVVENLFLKYGGETIALSRKDIAPNIFIPSKQQGVFYFNTHKDILLAFRYVGPDDYFAEALLELENYCVSKELQVNVLCEMSLDHMQQNNFSANAFGVVQRIPNLAKFTINGSKMRRLRYQVNKLQQAGNGLTTEYSHGSDGATDAAIASMIEKWANNKSGVNPYIWRVKDEMETGCLGHEYRIFLTHLDNNLQNVIIISKIESENSYLLDTEFYSSDMAMGAMEFAICEIIQLLKAEGCASFSLGLTFGSRFFDAPDCDPAVAKAFVRLAEDKIFEEAGNYQFKNKYRCKNSPLYLYRPVGQPASNVLDIIMMIGNPHSLKNQSAKAQKTKLTSHVSTTKTTNKPQVKHDNTLISTMKVY